MNQIINVETGEVIEDICVLDDDSLIGLVFDLRQSASFIKSQLSNAEIALEQRMNSNEATMIDTDRFTVKMLKGAMRYEYNKERIEMLKEHLSKEKYDSAVSYTLKVDKTKLNMLVKLGGKIKEIIESAVIGIPGTPKLDIELKPTDE